MKKLLSGLTIIVLLCSLVWTSGGQVWASEVVEVPEVTEGSEVTENQEGTEVVELIETPETTEVTEAFSGDSVPFSGASEIVSGSFDILSGELSIVEVSVTGLIIADTLDAAVEAILPKALPVFDDEGRVVAGSLQSATTVGGVEGVTYCSRIARENISYMLQAGGWTELPSIPAGDADDLIEQGLAHNQLTKIESGTLIQLITTLHGLSKDTIYDVYADWTDEEKGRVAHRITLVRGTDDQIYVLDPLRGNHTLDAQLRSEYITSYETKIDLQRYLSTTSYNPVRVEKTITVASDEVKTDAGVIVEIPAQQIEMLDIGGDSEFQTIDDFQINKIADDTYIIGDEKSHLEFGKPVQIILPTDAVEGEQVPILVQHEGDEGYTTRGLTTNPDATCQGGLSSDESNMVNVSGGQLSFYTCGASKFIADFQSQAGIDSTVTAIGVQSDGKILIGGSFTSYSGSTVNRMARLNTDDTLDTSFMIGSGFDNSVSALAVQSDGKIIVGGLFTSYNGISTSRIARLNVDGTIDTSFVVGSGFNSPVSSIAVQSDGKIIVGGLFTSYNGVSTSRIARLNANGTIDTSFVVGSGFNNVVNTIALQNDGKIVIGGFFTSYAGVTSNRIARLNADGTIDTGFLIGGGYNNRVTTLTVQSDGKILVGGWFTSYSGMAMSRIMRLNSDGTRDTSFVVGGGFNSIVSNVALQSDGKVLVGGSFTSYSGTVSNRIVRLNIDGTIDASFAVGGGFNSPVSVVKIQSNGKIVVGGNFSNYSGSFRNYIARLNSDGTVYNSFVVGGKLNSFVNAIQVQDDGKILIGGWFTDYLGFNRIARLNPDNSLDTGFVIGGGFDGTVNAITLQSDGKILVGGDFTTYSGVNVNRIARLNSDGSLDTGFVIGGGFDGSVNVITMQNDDKIVVGGQFTTYSGAVNRYIARLHSGGLVDTDFVVGGFDDGVYALVIQPDGKIIVGGYFWNYGGKPSRYIARLHTGGSLDTGFMIGGGFNDMVSSLALQEDGKILAGGWYFSSYNGTTSNRIARLNPDGTIDTGFDVGGGFDGGIQSLALQSDGKILAGGFFTNYSGSVSNRIARLNSDGTIDAGFEIGNGFNNNVHAIKIQNNDKILVGGRFTIYDGSSQNYFTRLIPWIPPVVSSSSGISMNGRGGGGVTLFKDVCPDGDFSPSYYDKSCGELIPFEARSASGEVSNSCYQPKDGVTILPSQTIPTTAQRRKAQQFLYGYDMTMFDSVDGFKPQETLTREQAAKMLVNYARHVLCKTPNTAVQVQYKDLSKANPGLQEYIVLAYQMGIMKGYNGTFRPKDVMTRAELQWALERTLDEGSMESATLKTSQAISSAIPSSQTVVLRRQIAEILHGLRKRK